MKKVIEVKNLVKDYDKLRAVDHISFYVEEGKIFGFLGPNGAGKTTTIKILCTLLKPTSGKAVVNGIDVQSNPHAVREQIGLVFQTESLDEKLTGMENLKFHSVLYKVPANVAKKRIKTLAGRVGLEERMDEPVRNYSGGMKRRLELIRGLIHHPKVLFLDEPTLGLDPQTRSRIWQYIGKMLTEEDISIFLTTHYMDEVEVAQRAAVIDKGQIIALDTIRALKEKVGGDVVTLHTEDDELTKKEIEEKFMVKAKLVDSNLMIKVDKGDEFIPELIKAISSRVKSINLRQPTMDDVFLELTGREIREGGPEKSIKRMMH